MNGPLHDPSRVLAVGAPLATARAAVILLHGRGGSADDMSSLASHLARPDVAFLVPEATGHTWYPQRYIAPLAANEPWLGSALSLTQTLVDRAVAAGMPAERVVVMGFSQGACLALEFAYRHPRACGTAIGLSGALIGPPGTPRPPAPGSMTGVHVLIAAGDMDGHVPIDTVRESADVFSARGATVDLRVYEGMGHTINEDELAAVAARLAAVAGR